MNLFSRPRTKPAAEPSRIATKYEQRIAGLAVRLTHVRAAKLAAVEQAERFTDEANQHLEEEKRIMDELNLWIGKTSGAVK